MPGRPPSFPTVTVVDRMARGIEWLSDVHRDSGPANVFPSGTATGGGASADTGGADIVGSIVALAGSEAALVGWSLAGSSPTINPRTTIATKNTPIPMSSFFHIFCFGAVPG
ncbi:hypothetical protein [Mycobacterium syngnathidarum]